jgi:hypothetical protein
MTDNTEYAIGEVVYLGWDQFGEMSPPEKLGTVTSVKGDVYTVSNGRRYLAENLLGQADVDDIG